MTLIVFIEANKSAHHPNPGVPTTAPIVTLNDVHLVSLNLSDIAQRNCRFEAILILEWWIASRRSFECLLVFPHSPHSLVMDYYWPQGFKKFVEIFAEFGQKSNACDFFLINLTLRDNIFPAFLTLRNLRQFELICEQKAGACFTMSQLPSGHTELQDFRSVGFWMVNSMIVLLYQNIWRISSTSSQPK